MARGLQLTRPPKPAEPRERLARRVNVYLAEEEARQLAELRRLVPELNVSALLGSAIGLALQKVKKGAAAGSVALLLLAHAPHGHAWGFWQHNRHAPASGPCAPSPKLPPMCWGGHPPGGQLG